MIANVCKHCFIWSHHSKHRADLSGDLYSSVLPHVALELVIP